MLHFRAFQLIPLPFLSTLFEGHNTPQSQQVFSFVAPVNMTSLQLDVLPLFQYLVKRKMMPKTTYLGTAQFGSEAMHTNGENVTFEASGIELEVLTKSEIKAGGKSLSKSSAVSLKLVQGFTWRWGLLAGAIGASIFWSGVL